MLRGPGLTPHKIRAERPSNLSFQKLRGTGLTPHFHDERSQTSLFELGFPRAARLLRFLTIAVHCTIIIANCVPWLCFDRRYVYQGPLCGRAAALEVSSSSTLRARSFSLSPTI